MKLTSKTLDGVTINYRAGTSDEQAIEEVLVKKAYRRVRDRFDVFKGERWLDLGANIGAFAVYCRQRGAIASCFEPEKTNFNILLRNIPSNFGRHLRAVSASEADYLEFRTSPTETNHYRGTIVEAPARYVISESVPNFCARKFLEQGWKFDGIKMDIEGAEGQLIDEWLLPKCEKLVMEYHTSRDSSVTNLKRRLKILKQHFKNVKYPSDYDKIIAAKATHYQPRFDKLIFCWGAK